MYTMAEPPILLECATNRRTFFLPLNKFHLVVAGPCSIDLSLRFLPVVSNFVAMYPK